MSDSSGVLVTTRELFTVGHERRSRDACARSRASTGTPNKKGSSNTRRLFTCRPKLDYESHAFGLDRSELGAMLVAAGLAGARDHALISLLALNGLRVSDAIGARIEDLALQPI